jgi:hypothetical protein
MTLVRLLHNANPTNCNGWHNRRIRKLIQSVVNCCVLVDPTNCKGIGIDYSACPQTGSYSLNVHFGSNWTEREIDLFVRMIKQIKHFCSVVPDYPLDNHQPSDTMPPCQEETEQQPRPPATLLT